MQEVNTPSNSNTKEKEYKKFINFRKNLFNSAIFNNK
nr:MAG TPA: hypothetical protein [Caudoviricetes sp.]